MTAQTFALHPRLAADTLEVARWDLSLVLLSKDATYPWLILVPQRAGLTELHDLSGDDLALVAAEIVRASRAWERLLAPDKINVGALGNLVPQLHIHVIARFTGDPAWPGPAWGASPPQPYDDAAAAKRIAALQNTFAES